MKELYIAPEAEIACFAPVERLANTPMADYSNLIGAQSDEGDSDSITQPIESNGEGNP